MSSRSFWRNEADKIRNDRSVVDTSELFANPWEEVGANPKRPNHLREIQLTLTAETKGSYILAGFVSSTHPDRRAHGRTKNRFRVLPYFCLQRLERDQNLIVSNSSRFLNSHFFRQLSPQIDPLKHFFLVGPELEPGCSFDLWSSQVI